MRFACKSIIQTILVSELFFLSQHSAMAGQGKFELLCLYTPRFGTIFDNKRYIEVDEHKYLADGYAAEITDKQIFWSDKGGASWQINHISGRFSVMRENQPIANGPCERVDRKRF